VLWRDRGEGIGDLVFGVGPVGRAGWKGAGRRPFREEQAEGEGWRGEERGAMEGGGEDLVNCSLVTG